MSDATTRAPSEIKADMQDVLDGAIRLDHYDTSEEALEALMPHVDRYVAAELRRLADTWQSGPVPAVMNVPPSYVRDSLLRRAAELDGGTDTTCGHQHGRVTCDFKTGHRGPHGARVTQRELVATWDDTDV